MKSIFTLRLLLSLISVFTLFAFAACSNDDDSISKTLFTVNIPPLSVDQTRDTWFFLTDNNGELLGIQEAVDGLDMIFERPSGFTGKTFSVHKLIYELGADNSYADFTISSYTGISGGQINMRPITNGSGPDELGEYSFALTGVPTGYLPTMLGPGITGGNFNGTGGNFTGVTGLTKNNIPLMFWWRVFGDRTKVPRYQFISDASAGQSSSTTFGSLSVPDEVTYNFNATIDRIEVRAEPYMPGEGYVGTFEYFTQTNVSSSKLYYPGSLYSSYNTWIRITDGSVSEVYNTIGEVPTEVRSLPATINSLSTEGNTLTISTTGTFDYMYTYGFTEWLTGEQEHWLNWFVYSDDSSTQTLNIPEFPAVLTERYPELLLATRNFSTVYVAEADNLEGYQDYLDNVWAVKTSPNFTESFNKGRNFSSGARLAFDQPISRR